MSTRLAPTISLVPHHSGFRDVTQGAANLTYTTPAYVSMDQPRSVTLLYSSGQHRPRGFIQVDATDQSVEAPVKMSIILYNDVGQRVDFTDGSQEIFYHAGAGTTRLAAHFDESRNPGASLAYGYTVAVRSWWADGSSSESARQMVRVPKIDASRSTFGAGWTMPGLQRLVNQGDGVFITQGDGTGVWFAGSTSGGYTAPDGDFTKVRWDASTGGWVREYPDGSTARFALNGLMVEQSDRFGNTTNYGYSDDAAARLMSITDPMGKVTTFGYNAEGVLGWIKDPMGRQVNTTTSSGYLWRLWDPDGSLALDLHFDVNLQQLQHRWNKGADRNVAGTAWSYGYDAHGTVSSITAPQVSTTDAGVTRPVTHFKSLQAAVLPAAGTGTDTTPAARVLPQNVRVEVTDPRGHTTKAAVDRFGSPTRVEAPLGRTSTVQRDVHSRVVRSAAPSGAVVRYAYHGSQLMQVTDSTAGQTVNYEYDRFDLVKRVFGNGPEESYRYFFTGNKTDSVHVSVSGRTTRVRFDGRGRDAIATDAGGHATRYDYDDGGIGTPGLGNVEAVAVGSDLAAVTTATYRQKLTTIARDVYGRQTGTTDPLNRSTSASYDLLNRTTRSVSAANDTTRYEYASAGHLWKVIDPKGQVYQYNRNALGWMVSQVDPRQQGIAYEYDRSGNNTKLVHRRGRTLLQTHDELNRVRTATDATSGAVTSYAYGPQDRWVAVSNPESTDTVHFDVAGRSTQHVTRRGTARYALSSAYDTVGLRTGLTMTSPWTRSIGYGYNAAMQLDTLTDLAGGRTLLYFDGEGQLYHTVLPLASPLAIRRNIPSTHVSAQTRYQQNGSYSNPIEAEFGVGYTQDKLGRTATRWSSDMRTRRTYDYDPAGRLKTYQDEEEMGLGGCPIVAEWDPETGVKLATSSGDTCDPVYGPTDGWGQYTYDRVGNHTGDGAVHEAGSNRLMQFRGYAMSYDNDGNLVSKAGNGETLTYDWNAFGQLASVTRNGVTTTFGYDGFGRRVRKSGPQGVRRYLYDGDNLFMELQDGVANPIREYTYYPGVDNPHSVRQGGQTYYYMMEAPGHVAGLVNSQGQVVSRYKYNPWGELESSTDPLNQPLRYTAREYDSDTGLYFYRARYYDPSLRRFISEDPIGLSGGINPYAYVSNNPIRSRDPYGLCEIDENASFTYTVPSTKPGVLPREVYVAICKDPEAKGGGLGGGANLGGGGGGGTTNALSSTNASGPVTYYGFNFAAVTGFGGVGAGGVYQTASGEVGLYGTRGYGAGLDISVGLEKGFATSMEAFQGRATIHCLGYGPASGCVARSPAGFGASGGPSVGPFGGDWSVIFWGSTLTSTLKLF